MNASMPMAAPALHPWFDDDAVPAASNGPVTFQPIRVATGTTLVHEGAPARSFYLVQAGHFKAVRNGEDGYEQVLDFAESGDVLGLDGLADGHHASGATALQTSWVVALPAADILQRCQRSSTFAVRWQSALAQQIARAGDRTWMMSAVGAEKRIARFLILFARRRAEHGESSRRLHLPMCRRDIGSHLGLSHETVSRSLTVLVSVNMLRVDNREIEILDPEVLRAFAFSTRGYANLRLGPGLGSTGPSPCAEMAHLAAA